MPYHACIITAQPLIVHRNISSNNILLNLELEAFVADFGMTMHLYCDSSNLTLLAGTYGYGAPDKLFRFSCFFIILKFKSNNISASFVGL